MTWKKIIALTLVTANFSALGNFAPANAQIAQPVPYGYCRISTDSPGNPNYPYTIVLTEVFDTAGLPETFRNSKAYVWLDNRNTTETYEYMKWDRAPMLAKMASFGFDDKYGIMCEGFSDRSNAIRMRNIEIERQATLTANFSTSWPVLTKPVPLNQKATDFLAGIVPPNPTQASGKRDSLIVRQPDEAPAKPVAAARKPVAKPKPVAAKPVAAKPAPKKKSSCRVSNGHRVCGAIAR